MTQDGTIFGRSGRRRLYSGAFVSVCVLATGAALVVLAAILISLLRNGMGGFGLALFTQDTPPPDASGGLRNAILGSIKDPEIDPRFVEGLIVEVKRS